MDFIWPPRLCCEMHRYSTRFAPPGCKTRSISDQIAKVQRLTANAKRKVFGNVKNADTLAPLSPSCFVAHNLSSPLRRARFWVRSKTCSLVAQIGIFYRDWTGPGPTFNASMKEPSHAKYGLDHNCPMGLSLRRRLRSKEVDLPFAARIVDAGDKSNRAARS